MGGRPHSDFLRYTDAPERRYGSKKSTEATKTQFGVKQVILWKKTHTILDSDVLDWSISSISSWWRKCGKYTEILVVRHRKGLILDPTHPYVPATSCKAPKTTLVNRSRPYQRPLVNSSILRFTKNRYGAFPPPHSSVPRPSYGKHFGDHERSWVDPQNLAIWGPNFHGQENCAWLNSNPPPLRQVLKYLYSYLRKGR